MAGKSNKSKNKNKPKVGMSANENHVEVATEDSGALMAETSDACMNDPNEQESKDADAGLEAPERGNDAEQQVDGTEGDTPDNAANGDSVDSSKSEGHSEGILCSALYGSCHEFFVRLLCTACI